MKVFEVSLRVAVIAAEDPEHGEIWFEVATPRDAEWWSRILKDRVEGFGPQSVNELRGALNASGLSVDDVQRVEGVGQAWSVAVRLTGRN